MNSEAGLEDALANATTGGVIALSGLVEITHRHAFRGKRVNAAGNLDLLLHTDTGDNTWEGPPVRAADHGAHDCDGDGAVVQNQVRS